MFFLGFVIGCFFCLLTAKYFVRMAKWFVRQIEDDEVRYEEKATGYRKYEGGRQ